jgi:flagellum-specific peptidoglycan hydrolase FlgJ
MSFYDNNLLDARRASAMTGLPVSVILAQWALETGKGTSYLYGKGNLAGIKYTEQAGSYAEDGAAGYYSRQDFLNDYSRVLHLSFYDHLRAAAAQGPEAVARAFTSAPVGVPRYAEDPAYSTKLIDLLNTDDLAQYDAAGSAPGVGGSLPPISAAQPAPNSLTFTLKDGQFPSLAAGTLAVAAGLLAVLIFTD